MPLPLLGKVALGLAVTTAVVMKDGVIEINVQEHHKNGDHVHLFIPATVATWGVQLAPAERMKNHLRHQRENLAIARTALNELEKLPDVDLVDVDSPREHVQVTIKNGNLIVDVDDPGETVHVRVPIRAARKVVEDLEAESPAQT